MAGWSTGSCQSPESSFARLAIRCVPAAEPGRVVVGLATALAEIEQTGIGQVGDRHVLGVPRRRLVELRWIRADETLMEMASRDMVRTVGRHEGRLDRV